MSEQLDEQKPVWCICPQGDLPFAIVEGWEIVREMIEDGEPEEVWCVKRHWLTQAEIDALPEHDGW